MKEDDFRFLSLVFAGMSAKSVCLFMDIKHTIPFEGERHNALDDARYQAKYVSVIWQKLIPSQADF